MREINLDEPTTRLTMISYGAQKVGKTEFLATMPRPLFISDGTEDGFETVKQMPRDRWYDPNHAPVVWAIDSAADFVGAVRKLHGMLLAKPDCFRSVILDTFTLIAQMFHTQLQLQPSKSGGKGDGRLQYGEVDSWMRAQQINLHKLPLHVAWALHERRPSEEDRLGGPSLVGRKAEQWFPSRCSLMLYHTVELAGQNREYVAYAGATGAFPAGGRFGDKVPYRMVDPCYRDLEAAIGLPEGPIPMKCPPLMALPTGGPLKPAAPQAKGPVFPANGRPASPTAPANPRPNPAPRPVK